MAARRGDALHPQALLSSSSNLAGADQVAAEAPPLGSLGSKCSHRTTPIRVPGGAERVKDSDSWAPCSELLSLSLQLWGQDLQVQQESQVRRTLPEAEHRRTAAGRMCDRQGKSGPCVSTAGHLLLLLTAHWRICRVGLSGTLCFRVVNEQRGKGLESVLQQSAEPVLPVLQALLVPQGLPAGDETRRPPWDPAEPRPTS